MKQKWYIHRISFRILFPALSGIILYLAMLMVFGNLEDLSGSFFSQEALFLVILTYINHEWAIFLLGRSRSQDAPDFSNPLRTVLYFVIMLLTSTLISSGIILAYFIFILGYYHFATELITINILMVLFQLLIHIYYISMLNIRRYHDLSMEQEDAQGRQLELELESFKSEMNPGLLLECLENLLTLVHKDVRECERYIQALSNQYRYLLDNRKIEFVDLDEELKTAGELVYLLNKGGATKITLEHKPSGGDITVIPGSLHHIIYHVENSQILTALNPLSLELTLDEERNLCIRHANRPKLVPGHTVKMDKLNRTYMHFTGRGITKREDGPWLEWNIPGLPDIHTGGGRLDSPAETGEGREQVTGDQ